MILSVSNLSKAFDETPVLSGVSFHIEAYDKAAVVGINGAGKTTLLRIIMGELEADEGTVSISKDINIGYLSQHQPVLSENTIYEELMSVKQNVIRLEQNIRSLELQMKTADEKELDSLMNTYTKLTHEFEMSDGYSYKSELTGVLKGLGFNENEFNTPISTLSGGQKTRVALGKLLLQKPNLIILDEPTNHLDMSAITWLENYLLNYKGAVILVSHDRYFINRIAGKIIEIDQTKSTVFAGNYTDYASKKEQLRRAAFRAYINQQRDIKHQEAVIEKLKSFNREKSIKRAESREKMLQKIERIEKPTEVRDDMHFSLSPRIVSGEDVLHIENLAKSFGALTLFKGLSCNIKRGEHVAIIGDNGTGKTTILKIINELIPPDEGLIRLGTNVEIGYYDQEHQVLHMDKTLFDEISDEYPTLTGTQIRNTLAAFLFTGEDVFKPISALSGGERGRLSLAKLMLSECNFLILDEPTNHLDITSKEILEDALNEYEGTVLYVSHDRYFINKTAHRILDLREKRLTGYLGNYEYYLEKKDEQLARIMSSNTATVTNASSDTDTASKQDWKRKKEEQAQIRKKENAIKQCEAEIEKLEAENTALDEQMALPEVCTDVAKLQILVKEKEENEARLNELYEKWEALNS